jgi:hypothetical protein
MAVGSCGKNVKRAAILWIILLTGADSLYLFIVEQEKV